MLTIATYILALKEFAKNRSISKEDFTRAVFDMLINPYDIQNQRKEPFDLNKSRISKILSGKSDVPEAIREVMTRVGVEDTVLDEFETFAEDYLDSTTLSLAVDKIQELVESDSRISLQAKNELKEQQSEAITYLSMAYLLAIKADNTVAKKNEIVLWSRGNSSVELISGDLFKFGFDNRLTTRNIVVIPVNTAFDTHISYHSERDIHPVVSENTVHGQWLKRITQCGLQKDELDRRIAEGLNRQNVLPISQNESTNGKQMNYPIGTVAVIETTKTVYYLLAVSQFDEKNIAHSTTDDIKAAILSLLQFYNENGQGYKMYMPLVGTGRSRTGMDYIDSLEAIKMVIQDNASLIQGEISIVAQPNIFEKITV